MKLHVFPPSPNAKKAMVVNAHLGGIAEIVEIDLLAGQQKSPEFLALNPNGKMPVLEFDDGATLWESNAIMNRLCAEADTPIWPKSNQRYDIMRWQFWEAAHWQPAAARFIARHLFGNESIDLEAAAEDFHKYASVLDGHLAGRDWLSGDGLTTADLCVAGMLFYRDRCQMPVAGYANIAAWLGRLEQLPAWQSQNQLLAA